APVGSTSVPDVIPRFEADLRGLRVDEVELELGRAVDAAVLGGLTELRIIHGKGTGAVKARVLELLPRDPRVQEFRPGGPGEGGGGVTVAALR
ncbi:MAG: Smr/MutS family protein, partial [Gemmatimonadota bacterium]